MKKWPYLLLIVAFTACKKEIPDPPTADPFQLSNQPYYNEYTVTFYTNTTANGPITVNINNGSATITYAFNYVPACNEGGAATFTLAPGNYTFSASATSGRTWGGNIIAGGAGQCIVKPLN